MSDRFSNGPEFTVHVPVHPYGTDPSQTVKAIGQPRPLRQRMTFTWIHRGGGRGLVARMAAPAGIVAGSAAIIVDQDKCVPGEHLIRIGPYGLQPGVDFVVGDNDIALAANLASAVTNLQGYSGTSDGADTVTISTTLGHGNDHRIEVVEWGANSAFTLAAVDRLGYLNKGAPTVSPPEFV